MFIFLIESKTEKEIEKCFKYVKKILGKELYKCLFEVVLTDNIV